MNMLLLLVLCTPFLVSGIPGSGKSLLVAKWISLHQRRTPGSLVLYHFVGSPTSCSANAVSMIRRITAQVWIINSLFMYQINISYMT